MTATVEPRPHRPAPHQIADEHRADAERALEVLLDPALEPIVDMVLTHRDNRYEALSAQGRVTFERTERGDFVEVSSEGDNPLADQSTDKFVGLDAERAGQHPHRRDNAYPFAYEQTAQLFDSPAAPDLCVHPLRRPQLGGPGRAHR